MYYSSSKQRLLISLLLIVFVILVSSPIFVAGYFGDDILNGLVLGSTLIEKISIFDFIQNMYSHWIKVGRFFPVSLLGYLFFYYFHTIYIYQIMRIIMIWVSLFSVAWLIKKITCNTSSALLIMFLIPACWSIRNYHDPLTSYGILFPMILLFSMISFGTFINALDTKRWYWLSISVFCYALSICTYEISILIFIGIIGLAWMRMKSIQQLICICLPYLLVTFIYIAVVIYLKKHSTILYSGTQSGTFKGWLHAFPNQLVSGLPLSYRLLSPKRYFAFSMISSNYTIWSQVIFPIGTCAISLLAMMILIPKIRINTYAKKALLWLGCCLIIIPTFLISICQKYQDEVHFGVGYLPVYLEYVGYAMCFLVLINVIVNKSNNSSRSQWIIATIFSLFASSSLLFNHYTVRHMNETFYDSRLLITEAVKHGLFSNLSSSSLLLQYNDKWNIPEFYLQNLGIKINIVDLSAINSIPANGTLLYYQTEPESLSGYVILANLKNVHFDTATINSRISYYTVTNPRIFIELRDRRFLFFKGKKIQLTEILTSLKNHIQPYVDLANIPLQLVDNKSWLIVDLPRGDYMIKEEK